MVNTLKWKRWAIGFAVWTLVGLSFATRSYLQAQFNGMPQSILEAIGYMADFQVWGVYSPLIFRFCESFPLDRKVWFERLPLYAVFCLISVPLVTAITFPVCFYLGFVSYTYAPTLWVLYQKMLFAPFLIHQGLLAFCGTVVVAHAMQYYRQVQQSRLRESELSTQLAQAQLAALKMQIHPHFLFNTLNSISSLLHSDIETADRMIARLSDFLRATLKSSDIPVVSLNKEVEFLQTYLDIEKVRFRDRLNVEIDIDEDISDAALPNLILQPLVENAVAHGIGRRTSAGRLTIKAQRDGDRVVITIEDDGPGYGDSHESSGNGIGLANTRARLNNFYGDYQFAIGERSNGEGTKVTINIPYRSFSHNEIGERE